MTHENYMRRCFELARLGAGSVSPNPMVGAVLVHDGRIIGEGWHRKYGGPHAEVNAVRSVREEDRHLIEKSTFYVSLEPCCIFGRTPPCTNLILDNKIPEVVISAIDDTPEVKGQGVSILREAGVKVTTGILKEEGERLAAIRNTFAGENRPYIILKWAESVDGFMGQPGKQVWISNQFSKRVSHRMRAEADAILVGTQTALVDDPQLNNRLWYGRSPLRILLDRDSKVSTDQKIFSEEAKTLVVTEKDAKQTDKVEWLSLAFDQELLPNLMASFVGRKISSLIVEGGAFTLWKFIEAQLWDEARVFKSEKHLGTGIKAPSLEAQAASSFQLDSDSLTIFRNTAGFR